MGREDDLQYWHNRGQTDASNGVDHEPHDLADRLIDLATFSVFTSRPGAGLTSEEMEEDRDAYRDGQQNHENQTSESDSCCYIVSACLDDLGLPRSSNEMRAMKLLAKDYVLKTFSGKRDYLWYGKVAPKIVSSIRSRPDIKSIWEGVYDQLHNLAPVILSGNYLEGRQKYKDLVCELQNKFS